MTHISVSHDYVKMRNALKSNISVFPLQDFKKMIFDLIHEYGIDQNEAINFIYSNSNYIYASGCPYADCIDIIDSPWYSELREILSTLDFGEFDDSLLLNRKMDIPKKITIHQTFSRTLVKILTQTESEFRLCDFILNNCTMNYIESVFFDSKLHGNKRLQKSIFLKKNIHNFDIKNKRMR